MDHKKNPIILLLLLPKIRLRKQTHPPPRHHLLITIKYEPLERHLHSHAQSHRSPLSLPQQPKARGRGSQHVADYEGFAGDTAGAGGTGQAEADAGGQESEL